MRALANFHDPTVRQFHSQSQNQKWNHDEVREVVRLLPLFHRRTIRDLAAALNVPMSTVHAMKCDRNDPVVIPTTSVLKPLPKKQHKLLRVCFCLSKMKETTLTYNAFYQSVHIDEEWFFISEKELRLYITLGEDIVTSFRQNKDHIMKVMFLCAVARPRYNHTGECFFYGKIGLFPFVQRLPAQRTSRNLV